MAWLWWVIAAFLLGGLELFTLDLVFGTLVVAALAGAGVALAGGNFTAQAVTASVVAVALLAVVRPLLIRRLKLEGRMVPSGTAAHVGRRARVLVEVTELGGRVKLAGEEWSARAAGPADVLAPGTAVEVVAIDGATAVVARSSGPAAAPDAPPPS